jgi:ribose 5-phosphate isomerase A
VTATPFSQSHPEDLTRLANAALAYVESGMDLGLGTGKAAEAFITGLAERARNGLRVRGVPTSTRSADLALRLGLEVITLDAV